MSFELSPQESQQLISILTRFGDINDETQRKNLLWLIGAGTLIPALHLGIPTNDFSAELVQVFLQKRTLPGYEGHALGLLLTHLLKSKVQGWPDERAFVEALLHRASQSQDMSPTPEGSTTTPHVHTQQTIRKPPNRSKIMIAITALLISIFLVAIVFVDKGQFLLSFVLETPTVVTIPSPTVASSNPVIDENRLETLNEAIRNNPQDSNAYYNRGLYYYTENNYDLAVSDYSAAIEIYSGFAQAYVCRGEVHRVQQNYESAIADYTAAIAVYPSGQAYYYRVRVYDTLNDTAKADGDFASAREFGFYDQPNDTCR